MCGWEVTRLITSVVCTSQPILAHANVTEDTCGSTVTRSAPKNRIAEEPIPCSIGSPLANICTSPADSSRIRCSTASSGDDHSLRSAVMLSSSRFSWRREP